MIFKKGNGGTTSSNVLQAVANMPTNVNITDLDCTDSNHCILSYSSFYNFTCNRISTANSSVCSGNGRCVTQDYCICNPGYFGNNCEDYTCSLVLKSSPSSCSGNGTCT